MLLPSPSDLSEQPLTAGAAAVALGQSIIWQPQPGPQTALVACPVFEVFFGGARGGGKTDGSLGDWLQHSSTYGQDAVGVFFRRKFRQLSEVIARSKQLFKPLGAKYNEQKAEWVMPGGARLLFRYLEKDSDAEEYQGHNYTRVYIEEVTNFPSPAPINLLRATLRSARGVPVGMRLTGNPGGPGHSWVKKRYIDPAPQGYAIIRETEVMTIGGVTKEVALDRVFIPSKLQDNTLLLQNDPTYVLRLRQSGSETLVRAWLEGDWTVVNGAFFDEWEESKHVLDTIGFRKLLNPGMRGFRSFDWGSAKPFSSGWYAILDRDYDLNGKLLPKNALVKFAEWYGAKGPNQGLKMTATAVADGIKQREQFQEMGLLIKYGVADPAIFIRDGGPSIAEDMARHGITYRRADNKRKAGWEQLHNRLQGDDGVPMLYVCDICDDTIRTLPILPHDEGNPEDIDTDSEDHAADETRYAVMSRPWIPRVSRIPGRGLPKLPSEMTIAEIVAKRTAQRREAEGY